MARTSGASRVAAAVLLATGLQSVAGQFYNIDTSAQIKASSKTLAAELMSLYPPMTDSTAEKGILPGPPDDGKGPYYWWQGGALMGTMIDYWHLTGDTTYNTMVTEGMLAQVGTDKDYQPLAHRASLGNDDQGFWGMSAMLAAENKFPDPPSDKPQWLALAQAVWTTQAAPERHDKECGGGMRWQVPLTNTGYNYKNTIANAIFFNLGARLARYTSNDTYAKWAEETWDWVYNIGYIDNADWKVYDGAHVEHNCTDITKSQFSYNIAVLIHGCAYMYNYTAEVKGDTAGAAKWKTRLQSLTESIFRDMFVNGVAFEIACETGRTCTQDMLTFKGYVHRWLAVVTQVAPFMADTILPVLKTSAQAAVKQCTGGSSGHACGFYWSSGVYSDPAADRTTGAGERQNVLAAVSSLLIGEATGPVTNTTGGTSQGDPNAGMTQSTEKTFNTITTADRAGAGILTILLLGSAGSAFTWMNWDR